VLLDNELNPKGTVASLACPESGQKNFMKIISLARESCDMELKRNDLVVVISGVHKKSMGPRAACPDDDEPGRRPGSQPPIQAPAQE